VSTLGHGSTFRFTLPVVTDEQIRANLLLGLPAAAEQALAAAD
jgi:hypothetical protein